MYIFYKVNVVLEVSIELICDADTNIYQWLVFGPQDSC